MVIPVLLWAVALIFVPSVVAGLAFGRRAGLDGPADIALMVPLGLATIVLAAEIVDLLGGSGWTYARTTVGVGAFGLADLLVTRGGRLFISSNARHIFPPIGACAGTFGLLALPWLHVPTRGILGYSQLNDQVVHALIAKWISMGRPPVTGVGWDFALAQPRAGYPVGAHELLAVVLAPVPDIQQAYSPTLAILVAFSACPAYWLIRRFGSSNLFAMVGGAVAGGSFLQLGYTSQGYLPSMVSTALVLTAVALVAEVAAQPRTGVALAAGLATGASAVVYSLSVGVYLLAPAGCGLIYAALACRGQGRNAISRWRDLGAAIVGVTAATALIIAPVAASSWKYFAAVFRPGRAAPGQIGGASDLGNLLHPLPFNVVFGSWISSDYRLDYERGGRMILGASVDAGLSRLGTFAAVVLILCAAVFLRHGRAKFLLALSGPIIAILYIRVTQGPYYVAKSYQTASVFFAASVFVGVENLSDLRWDGWMPRIRRHAARTAVVASLLLIWCISALASDSKESTSASIPPPLIRTDLPAAAAAAERLGLIPAVTADTGIWSYLAAPYASSTTLTTVRVPGGVPDADSVTSYGVGTGAIISAALGGLSVPAPPFRSDATFGTVRLYTLPKGTLPPPPTLAAENAKEVGAARLEPGEARSFNVGSARRALVGVLDPDDQYVPFTNFSNTGARWTPWDQNPDTFVPVAGESNGGLTYTIRVQTAGLFRVNLVGLYFRARLTIDGQTWVISGGQIRSPLIGPILPLSRGSHTVALRPSLVSETSYAQALSIERVGSAPPVSYICVQDHRYAAYPGRPAAVTIGSSNLRVRDCGLGPIALDWVLPI